MDSWGVRLTWFDCKDYDDVMQTKRIIQISIFLSIIFLLNNDTEIVILKSSKINNPLEKKITFEF